MSILIFNLTIGWLLQRMVMPVLSARVIGWVVAVAMFVEISAIVMQAARGVPSHYNFMAVAIVLNTVALGWLCVISFGPQSQLPPAVVWGIRLGLILFLFSSFQGFQIVGHKGHTVGASDGGPGLPFLRWSTVAGDLRIAHFIGIHGIQMLPLLGFFVSRTDRQAGSGVVASAFAAIAALFFWALAQAWAGRPLLR
ncbi:MAG: hypothetical protein NTV52_31645 [Acidobacteria bacterium]|nr:hypothetical protein [Acidobacteriota bacterium]